MPLYTFYPLRADGASTVFETHELADDARALLRARAVLREHPSAAEVVVWQGEREVGLISRSSELA